MKRFNNVLTGLLLLTLLGCTQTQKASTPKDVNIEIHVNQVAINSDRSKSAIVSVDTGVDLTGLAFHLTDGNANHFSGKLQHLPEFTEWQKEKGYFKADFSEFASQGTYHLSLEYAGKSIKSGTFVIGENSLLEQTLGATLHYFNASRNDEDYNWLQDQKIRVFDEDRYVDVRGGWNDAGGDTGKYLSHLSYANFMNPQQLALVAWALGYSYQSIPQQYEQLELADKVIEETFWGADFLVRMLDPEGYFYMTVFDRWHTENAERVITAYVGLEGKYTENYQAALREGAGAAIAALARAANLAESTKKQGEFGAQAYLTAAEKAFAHYVKHNASYGDDGKENIIDDYSGLLAAIELFRTTKKNQYLEAARVRANKLNQRMTKEGWLISNDIDSPNPRPFYHAAEAGFPVFALSQYLDIESDQSKLTKAKNTIAKSLQYQLNVNQLVSNPFNYARQHFKQYQNNELNQTLEHGFFIPHANETNYWWQGESARLSSLTAAALIGSTKVDVIDGEGTNIEPSVLTFAQNQLDWTLGRNPYNMTMINGFGTNNPVPYQGLGMEFGGISNGITGSKTDSAGRGIEFAPETTWHNWRWVEQWLPHSTWYLIAMTEMAKYPQVK